VLVSGRLQSRQWEQDGQKRSKLEVVANDVTFLGGREGGGEGGVNSGGYNNAPAASGNSAPAKKKDVVIEDIGDEPINLDDIPF
jgi:single-strand DNA-binding protein